jgi:hypothetical protein
MEVKLLLTGNLEMDEITKDTLIEDLVNAFPLAIPLLSQFGIRCILCGEPTWGTIGSAAKEKYIEDKKLDEILIKLNKEYLNFINKKVNKDF